MSNHSVLNKAYTLLPNGDFVIENYQQKKTFASFLPGIAGSHGIPLWVFYVNRGQGIASFGVADKDHALMEFYPANKAYQNVQTKGFRTFIKLKIGERPVIYEPFRCLRPGVTSKMIISLSALAVEEEATDLGLKTRSEYFILPEESFAALVRKVTIENLKQETQALEVLDGMPIVIPYGFSNQALKEMSQTIAAWARVHGLEEKTAFYRTDASTEDRTEVEQVEAGNFFIALTTEDNKLKALTPLVDPEIIFAEDTGLEQPLGFLRTELWNFHGLQKQENQFPSALAACKKELGPNEKLTLFSVLGFLPRMDLLTIVRDKCLTTGYLEERQARSGELHRYYADHCLTVCNEPRFTYYTRQTFIDNVLRGGFPLNLGRPGAEIPYYVFSRKHGDLERDYNQFYLAPTFYSHGNGNFRDVLQNRRCDLYFNPLLKTANIKTFASLIQPDGFNPLVIKGTKYYLAEQSAKELALSYVPAKDRAKLEQVLSEPFFPGSIATLLTEEEIKLSIPLPDFLSSLMKNAVSWPVADFGEGFWIDHWTYLLDLIESYLGVYPDELFALLWMDQTYTFYDSYVKVKPRRKKYVLTAAGPRQTEAVTVNLAKKKLISERKSFPTAVRVRNGQGEIYQTNLFVILFTLVLNKLSSLDPHGVGLEMEAGKPGWYDALNGLPGLFGSSTPETMELLRLSRFMYKALAQLATGQSPAGPALTIKVPTEVYDFYRSLDSLLTTESLAQEEENAKTPPLRYWAQASTLREQYREAVFPGFTGTEQQISISKVQTFLSKAIVKLENAVQQGQNRETGLFDTYYTNLPVKYQPTGEFTPEGLPYIEVTEFGRHPLPLFLEGQVRGLKVLTDPEQARALHRKVCGSDLYDQPLGMFRVNADLKGESFAIGRARAFTTGWLENGSIWLHMEYKYLLELLRTGLYDEFYKAADSALIPALNPEVYGRSILENSSFILSSLNPDRQNHGRGYIARLSGSTAEFLSIWAFLSFGPRPFRLEGNELVYAPEPVLSERFFTEKPQEITVQWEPHSSESIVIPVNAYAYRFLGTTLVVYHNPERRPTFGQHRVEIHRFELLTRQGERIKVDGSTVPAQLATAIRNGQMRRIDAFFK